MYDVFQTFLESLIRPLYERLGFEDKGDDDNFTIMLKMHTRKWACKLNIGNCKFYAAYYFNQKLRHSDT